MLLVLTLSLTGCVFRTSEGQAVRRAERGVALAFDTVATAFSRLVFDEQATPVTVESLQTVARYVLLDADAQHTEGLQRGPTIYAFVSEDDYARISVFAASTVQVSEGLGGEFADRFGCATLTADFPSGQISLDDEECPAWLLDWNGDRAREVAVSDVVSSNGGDGTW